MPELGVDVFKSALSTTDWVADPEVGGEMHLLSDTAGMEAGLSRFSEDTSLSWELPTTEILLVLEGEARIEIADGPTLELGPGDMATLPEGAHTTWQITAPFVELWVLKR